MSSASVLEPTPSLSRSGQTFSAGLSMKNLSRSPGRSSKKKKETIPIHEILDTGIYDRFGVGSESDRGRKVELLSSPRGLMPEQDSKSPQASDPDDADLIQQFLSNPHLQKKLGSRLLSPRAAHSLPTPREQGDAIGLADLDTRSPVDETTRATSPSKKEHPGWYFRTAERFRVAKETLEAPPVTKYNPRFSHVDPSSRKADFNYRPPSPTKRSYVEEQEASYVSERTAKLVAKDEAHSPSPRRRSPPRSPTGASPAAQTGGEEDGDKRFKVDYDWVNKRIPKKEYQNAIFVSKADRQLAEPLQSPDKYYWPYPENQVKKREPGFEIDKQMSRDGTFKRPSSSPNRYYDLKFTNVWKKEDSNLAMDKQLERGRAMQDAQTMLSKKKHAPAVGALRHHQYPADARFYDANDQVLSIRGHYSSPDLSKLTTRENAATAFHVGNKVVMNDPKEDYNPQKAPKVKPVKVDLKKQLARKEHAKVFADLEYDVSRELVETRSPTAPIDVLVGHKPLTAPSITRDVDYNPQFAQIKQRAPVYSFDKGAERVESPSAFQVRYDIQPLDKFYDDQPGMKHTRPRTTGDPLLRTHLSRKDMDRIYRSRAVNLDKFYDASVAQTKPKTSVLSDMKKELDREKRTAGRFAPGPKSLDTKPKGPDVGVYDTTKADSVSFHRTPNVVLPKKDDR